MQSKTAYTRHGIHCLALVSCLMCTGLVEAGALERLFAPKAELWAKWTQYAPDSSRRINHSSWDRFLHAWIITGKDGINRLPYGNIARQDRQALSDYLSTMQQVIVSTHTRDQQLAYWVNLYNALTVKIILEHYPVDSIRDIDISPGLFSDGPWGKKIVKIEGEALSLNDIEHRILRPVWKDPRIHYVVNCASLGCPNLRQQALTAANIETELNAAAREFVNHDRGARFENDELYVSSLYSWFQQDFGMNEKQVIEHLELYADKILKQKLQQVDSIAGDSYDWRLNDATRSEVSDPVTAR